MNRCIAQFDRLYQDGATQPRVMAISLHPYLSGVPHRIGYLEKAIDHIRAHDGVAWMTGEEIADWYRAATNGRHRGAARPPPLTPASRADPQRPTPRPRRVAR
jgi:hypothetical protein